MIQNMVAVSNGGPGLMVGEGSVIDSMTKTNGSGAAIVGLVVRGCTAANNVAGIAVRPGGVASGNVAVANWVTGINISNATATHNTANNNGTHGVDAVCPGVLANNTATNNAGGNIQAITARGTCS